MCSDLFVVQYMVLFAVQCIVFCLLFNIWWFPYCLIHVNIFVVQCIVTGLISNVWWFVCCSMYSDLLDAQCMRICLLFSVWWLAWCSMHGDFLVVQCVISLLFSAWWFPWYTFYIYMAMIGTYLKIREKTDKKCMISSGRNKNTDAGNPLNTCTPPPWT